MRSQYPSQCSSTTSGHLPASPSSPPLPPPATANPAAQQRTHPLGRSRPQQAPHGLAAFSSVSPSYRLPPAPPPESAAPLRVWNLPCKTATGVLRVAEGCAAALLPSRLRQNSGRNRNGSCPEPSRLAALPYAAGPPADFRFRVAAAS